MDTKHWVAHTDWRSALVRPVVPEGEGPTQVLSIRVPAKLIQRLDVVAKATGNSRTEVLLHLVRWGLDEYERQRSEEKPPKR
jgi:hypothetical protein